MHYRQFRASVRLVNRNFDRSDRTVRLCACVFCSFSMAYPCMGHTGHKSVGEFVVMPRVNHAHQTVAIQSTPLRELLQHEHRRRGTFQ